MSILDKLRRGIATASPEQMEKLAASFAEVFPENTTLALSGDLGAGKTVFVKGLAKAWGIEETVTSPTFNIFSVYSGKKRNLVHLDAYRLESADGMEPLMVEDFLEPPYCLAIEWPEKIAEWLPRDHWKLFFSIDADGRHVVRSQ